MWIGHRNEIRKLTFRALALRRSRRIDSLRRRANARNVSFRISLRWPIHIINPVDKTKLSCYAPRRRSTTVSLETYPLYSFILGLRFVLAEWCDKSYEITSFQRGFLQEKHSTWELLYIFVNHKLSLLLCCYFIIRFYIKKKKTQDIVQYLLDK